MSGTLKEYLKSFIVCQLSQLNVLNNEKSRHYSRSGGSRRFLREGVLTEVARLVVGETVLIR
jgi:hypothetical protein